jgi:hypothetical protein
MDSGNTDCLTFKGLLPTIFLPKDHDYQLRVQKTNLNHNKIILWKPI